MRLDPKAMAVTCGVMWAGAVFLVALGPMLWPSYGRAFLEVVSSIYPGYKATPGLGQAVVGALYALLDGAIGGALFAWVYNLVAARTARA